MPQIENAEITLLLTDSNPMIRFIIYRRFLLFIDPPEANPHGEVHSNRFISLGTNG